MWFRPVTDSDDRTQQAASAASANQEDDWDFNFALERAELEIILSGKQNDDLDFLTAVRSAIGSTGNNFLFSLPADRFPLEARNVAAIEVTSGDLSCAHYVFETPDGAYQVAGPEEIGRDLTAFATNFSDILNALNSSRLH